MNKLLAAVLLGLVASPVTAAATPTLEEMWAIIQEQQTEIARLKAQVAVAHEEIKETSVKVEATANIVEDSIIGGASMGSGWTDRTKVGAYAELHYNNLDNQNGIDGAGDKDEIDFHRFVFYLSHDFSDNTRLFSEVELEHSFLESGDSNGELELEQAYIEHDLNSTTQLKAGLFLIPVGILNQTHEPDTFYGVERNNVESNVIPATWWEGGVAVSGEIAPGWRYDTAFTSGLRLDANNKQFKIRDGRQKVSAADASDPAYTANLKFTGIAGLELGATLQYQQDIYQGEYSQDVDAVLYSAHLAYRNGSFGLRALAASWDIDDAIENIKTGAATQEGWYVEPSWKLLRKLGLFARYSEWDNQAGGGGDTEFSEWDLGLNYWLEEHVVLKLDYQFQDAPDKQNELEGINLGVGWSF